LKFRIVKKYHADIDDYRYYVEERKFFLFWSSCFCDPYDQAVGFKSFEKAKEELDIGLKLLKRRNKKIPNSVLYETKN
jgi:hypothetical protein